MDAITRKAFEDLAASLRTPKDFVEVSEVMRRCRSELMGEQTARFRPGERVRWWHKGAWHTGTVRKRNPKTLRVVEDGTEALWLISPAALISEAGTERGS